MTNSKSEYITREAFEKEFSNLEERLNKRIEEIIENLIRPDLPFTPFGGPGGSRGGLIIELAERLESLSSDIDIFKKEFNSRILKFDEDISRLARIVAKIHDVKREISKEEKHEKTMESSA